jgi:transposase InsO family protein
VSAEGRADDRAAGERAWGTPDADQRLEEACSGRGGRRLLGSDGSPEHKIWPYLLRNKVIDQPNQVWCADITYIPMRRGFLYLVAVMDWASRKVLSWRLPNTMDVEFCSPACGSLKC